MKNLKNIFLKMKRSHKNSYFLRNKKSLTEEKSGTINNSGVNKSNNLENGVLSKKDTGEKILELLSTGDLCNVALVSERLHTLASDSRLWKGVSLNQKKLKEEGLSQYFADCKVIRFKTLKLCGKVTKKDCQALLDQLNTPGNKIEEVDFTDCDLKEIPPAMLSQTVTKLEKVNFGMDFPSMTTTQIDKILTDIGNSKTLKDLQLCLRIDELSSKQKVKALKMCQEAEAIKELWIGKGYIEHVPATLLADVVAKMRKVTLQNYTDYQDCDREYLTQEQTSAIFDKASKSTSLVELDIGNAYYHIKKVSPESLANTMAKLKRARLYKFTAAQSAAVFDRLAFSNNLEELSLVDCDMSEVSVEQLKLVMKKNLRIVEIYNYDDNDMMTSIFEALAENKSLIDLDLRSLCVDIPANLVRQVVSGLNNLSFIGVGLEDEQLIALFEQLAESDSLKKVFMMDTDLSEVPVNLLHRISARIGKEKLLIRKFGCYLTEEQCSVEYTDEDDFCHMSVSSLFHMMQ